MTLNSSDFEVRSGDGRRLQVSIAGPGDGYPVFLIHGTPGSRRGPRPRGIVLYRLGIRLISYDRPGYGHSDRAEGRAVADAARDVVAIANALQIKNFAVVGRSGGGPHALAVAALCPDLVSSAAVLVSLAPFDAGGLSWYEDMNDHNVREYTAADNDDESHFQELERWAEAAGRDPHHMIERLREDLCEFDHRVVGDVALRRLLLDTYEGGSTARLGGMDRRCRRLPQSLGLRIVRHSNANAVLARGGRPVLSRGTHVLAAWTDNRCAARGPSCTSSRRSGTSGPSRCSRMCCPGSSTASPLWSALHFRAREGRQNACRRGSVPSRLPRRITAGGSATLGSLARAAQRDRTCAIRVAARHRPSWRTSSLHQW